MGAGAADRIVRPRFYSTSWWAWHHRQKNTPTTTSIPAVEDDGPVPPPPKCCGGSRRRGFCCWHRSILFHSMYCIIHPSARDAANATHAVELHYLSCHEMYSTIESEFLIIRSFQFYYLDIDRRSIPDSNVLYILFL